MEPLRRLARRPQSRRRACPRTATRGSTSASGRPRCPTVSIPLEWGYERVKRDLRDSAGQPRTSSSTPGSASRASPTRARSTRPSRDLHARGVVYDEDGAVWLRTTDFGDDKDRVLVKSDGEPTYLLPDIAYHRDKFAPRLTSSSSTSGVLTTTATWPASRPACRPSATGPTSSRSSSASSWRSCGAARRCACPSGPATSSCSTTSSTRSAPTWRGSPSCCSRSTPARRSTSTSSPRQSNDNPVFYVQYANARIHSIGRRGGRGAHRAHPLTDVDLALLTHERELDLLRKLSELPGDRRAGLPRPGAAQGHDLGARARRSFPRLLPRLLRHRRRRRPRSRRPVCGSWRPPASGLSIGLDLLGVSAPESM